MNNSCISTGQLTEVALRALGMPANIAKIILTVIYANNGNESPYIENCKPLQGKSFLEITIEDIDIAKVDRMGEKGKWWFLWLQRYLRGEEEAFTKPRQKLVTIKAEEYEKLCSKIDQLEACLSDNGVEDMKNKLARIERNYEDTKNKLYELEKESAEVKKAKKKLIEIGNVISFFSEEAGIQNELQKNNLRGNLKGISFGDGKVRIPAIDISRIDMGNGKTIIYYRDTKNNMAQIISDSKDVTFFVTGD